MRKLVKFLLTAAILAAAVYLLWTGLLREQWLLYRYPIKYSEIVEACADEFSVPSEIVYAVIHTESSFEVSATSRAGAKGLMQIMDDTNEWIASVMGEDAMSDRLYEPSLNIRRGTWLLAYLYRQFGTWNEAFAAYNAGYGRVTGWLGDPSLSADGKTLDVIPISETREYVERVAGAVSIYRELYFDEN